jgi:hypothetical protein
VLSCGCSQSIFTRRRVENNYVLKNAARSMGIVVSRQTTVGVTAVTAVPR